MDGRIIKISSFTDVGSLKRYILQKLKLIDHKADYVNEFYERIRHYIDRNKNLKIVFQLDRDRIEKDLKFKLSLIKSQQPYPDNYEMGNPHNRWIYEPVFMTEEEARRKELEYERNFNERISTLNQFLHQLEQMGSGQILVKDS